MKKYLMMAALLLTCCVVVFSSCSSDDDPVVDESEYYIKYSYKKSYGDIIRKVETSHGNDFGIYGPVKKGFRAWMRIDSPFSYCVIEVSKDNGPFAIKASSKGYASYTIE